MSLGRLRSVWGGLDTRGQIMLIGSALAIVVTAFFLFQMASRPSYSTLAANLDPADTAEATRALDSAGISYKISNGGTEIRVRDGQESQARVALAEKGVLNGGHVGFEIFDDTGLGVTDFQQRVDYQRALEGEIARTIEGIAGVSSAGVQLVMPEESLFTEDAPKPTAAVLVRAPDGLDEGTVRGIAHLVASSVRSLDPSDVTITDANGTMLWPRGDGAAAGGAGKIEAEQRYAAQLASQINALLVSTLGPGKATARVHADLNVDQTTIDRVTYADRGTPIEADTEEESFTSQNGGAAPPAGVSGNTPSYAGSTGSNGRSNYTREKDRTTYGVDKTIERTVRAPGSVNKLDVALVVDSSVPEADAAALQASVAGLAGIDTERGDTITLSRIAFAAPAAAGGEGGGGGGLLADPLGLAKTAGLAVAALGFLFLMRRGLKRREGEASVPEPTWVREIEHALPLEALEQPAVQKALRGPQPSHALREDVEELARSQPQAIATQVTQWMKE